MKKIMLVIIASMLFILPGTAFAALAEHPGCSGNCLECHKFDKQEAEAILKKLKDANPTLPSSAQVKDVKMAPAGGLWQIDIDVDGKSGALFVDITKKYLVTIQAPGFIPIETIKPQVERKIDFSSLPLKDAFVLGSKKAAKKVAVFTDPDCPACRALHEEIKKVLAKRKDVAFYLFFNPLPMHKDSPRKALAILCEKSVEVLDAAYAGKAVPEPKCKDDRLAKSEALAKKLEFNSTPTLVREDGKVNTGALPADRLIEWISGK